MNTLSEGGRGEALFRGLFESAPDATFVVDEAGEIVMVNAQAEALFGYDRQELLGQRVEVLIPERHRVAHPGHRATFLAAAETRPMGEGRELFARLKDASELPVEVSLSPLETEQGTLVSAAVRDISERVRAERELAATATRLQATFDAMPGGLSLRSLDGRYLKVNAYVARALGRGTADLVGFNPASHHGDTAVVAEIAEDDIEMRRTKQPITREMTFTHADGTRHDYLVLKYPILDAEGEVSILGALSLDVTERRRVEEKNRRLASIVESSDDAIIVKAVDGTITEWNRGAERLYGYRAKEAIGQSVEMLLPPERRAEEEELLRRVVRGERVEQHEEERIRKDGSRVYLSLTFSPVFDQNGKVAAVSTSARDITERRRVEEANRRLASIVESSDDAIIVKTVDGTITEWNKSAERLYGYSAEEAIGRPVGVLLPPEHQAEEKELLRRVARGEPIEQHEEERMRKDGTRVFVSLTFSPVRNEKGAIIGISTIARDISERKRFEGQLRYLADHDLLSGLFNRRRFEEEVNRELLRAQRTGRGGALLAIDLDHFKYVNDSLGHAAGDQLIAAVGAVFRGRVRESDTLARIGGDEFAVFLPGVEEYEARHVAASLIETLRSSSAVELPGLVRRVTASIGIAPFSQVGELTAEDLMVEADIAMYDAKEEGRNRASVYDAEAGRQARMEVRLSWTERIRDAINAGRLVLHAQPILALDDNTASRYELLVRMLDEHGDLIPPGVFLYIAERMGLIEDLDRWVLHNGIGFLADQQRKGHDISVELNLSAKSISASETPALVAHELKSAGANPHGLCIEITETAAIVNVERAKQLAGRLGEMGCEFALDDFGAGFASFYYLKHLAFDYLKIDGEFIKDVRHNRTDQLVVRSLVEIAHGLGKKTIAEFVGDRDALELLRRYGVDYAQGFYVAKPMPLSEVEAFRPTSVGTLSSIEAEFR